MKIAIVGAGAIGTWVGARLAETGHDLSALARGDTLAALQSRGLGLKTGEQTTFHPCRASAEAGALGVQDIVMIAVKAQALPTLAPAIGSMIGTDTMVVPMLNGVPWWFMGEGQSLRSVDPELSIERSIPRHALVGCVVHASAAVPEPGISHLRMCDKLIVGEPSGGVSARVGALRDCLESAGIPTVTSEDIRKEVWYKLWGNMTMNPMSALTLATMDCLLDDPLLRTFALQAMEEARSIGARIGCPITESGEARMQVTRKLGAFKTSMLQDVEAGRSLELDALLAAPLEIAQAVGAEAPYLGALFGLARTMGRSRQLY
ncbi:2-dehydropantoate 2-reductase [Sphingobium sp. MK2]|uniref:2-dehydropantoate 2-reductase n=1 Tax=Sphingobium sp. MK2 TaxID=3116540 RepID=UPI0032E359C2